VVVSIRSELLEPLLERALLELEGASRIGRGCHLDVALRCGAPPKSMFIWAARAPETDSARCRPYALYPPSSRCSSRRGEEELRW
jgi:hypothetical protein